MSKTNPCTIINAIDSFVRTTSIEKQEYICNERLAFDIPNPLVEISTVHIEQGTGL